MTAEALGLGFGAPLSVVLLGAAATGLAMGTQSVIFQTAMQTSIPPAAAVGMVVAAAALTQLRPLHASI